jgi:hypothetical protein
MNKGDGTWTLDTKVMEDIARDFFQKLYIMEDDADPDIVTN